MVEAKALTWLWVRGRRELVTLVGHAAAVAPGGQVQASGTWVNDRTHGVQFQAAYLHPAAPTSVEGIEKYLGSGLIKGIGPHYAARLVAAFGTAVFDVVEREPDRLRDLPGIGPVRAARIAEGWREQRTVRDIMVFLHSHGVGDVSRRPDLQDLWVGRDRAGEREPVSPGA